MRSRFGFLAGLAAVAALGLGGPSHEIVRRSRPVSKRKSYLDGGQHPRGNRETRRANPEHRADKKHRLKGLRP